MPRVGLCTSLSPVAFGALLIAGGCAAPVGDGSSDVSAQRAASREGEPPYKMAWDGEEHPGAVPEGKPPRGVGKGTYRITWDDFRDGFSINEPGADWFYFSAGPFVGDDGIASTSPQGLRVIPKGQNAAGEPAFTKTVSHQDEANGIPGGLDHVKWLVYMNHLASTGVPGFDAEDGKVLSCESWVGGQTYGVENHPFGDAVNDASDDSRLAAFAMNAIDFETLMVFDFFMSEDTIYALYERLPFARAFLGNYAAFTYQIPVADNDPGQINHLKISYDRAAGTVSWYVNGKRVFQVDQLGHRLDSRDSMSLDHGGTEQLVEPRQLNCGMGTFTLLDAYQPSEQALVRLSTSPDFYFDPSVGAPEPLDFVDEQSLPSSRLFGQGAEIRARRYVVSSRPGR